MLFDARQAKALQPGEHMTVGDCPGLRLEASGSTKTWTYRYKNAAGLMKQIKIGHWPKISANAAGTKWEELRTQKAAGLDPRAARKAERSAQPVSSEYTVAQMVQAHLEVVEDSREDAGALAARRQLERMLAEYPDYAAMPAAKASRTHAFDILDALKATPTAAQKLRSLMGAAVDTALDAGKVPQETPNWWRAVMKGKLKSKGKIVGGEHQGQQRRHLQPEEITALLQWLPNMHALGRDATQMYLWTCTRGAEFFALEPKMVRKERDGWWWTMPKAITKNRNITLAVDQRVPLIGRALEVVTRRLDGVGKSGYLFEDARAEQYTQHDFSTYIYNLQPYSSKVQGREGEGLVLPVTHWTPHDMRRTSRTLLASLGCPNEIAEAILGHMPRDIVGVYNAYSYDAERRHWLGALDKHLEHLARPG